MYEERKHRHNLWNNFIFFSVSYHLQPIEFDGKYVVHNLNTEKNAVSIDYASI